ncbi:Ribokinase-like protein [Dendrothele bispora CBS 962.96]|uniref:Ribokinase n=1 Tax=Dendrothele bispora (strain CBS 962.96) TaxID=1314807 RepID=A0A4S8M7N6_DENBC|nr:Ribokinase-like protein [Dendrothele bispora CBS 962.96]
MTEPVRCLIRGSINVDEYFQVKNIVRPGETISSDGLEKKTGGKGANQAVAVARAGGIVDLVGAVGEDGVWTRKYLEECGVDVKEVEVVKEPTGRALIQVAQDGENSIVLFKGANFTVLPKKPSFYPRTTHLLLQNEIPLSETLAYIHAAAAADGPNGHRISTTFNPSPMPSDEELKMFPWDKLDWLIVNEGEAEDMYKVLAGDKAETEVAKAETIRGSDSYAHLSAYPIVLKLSSLIPKTNIICTLGAKGVLALVPSLQEESEKGKPHEPIFLPAAKLQGGVAVDTTGAGDTFAGYAVAGLMKLSERQGGGRELTREDVREVLRRCVQAAGMCVEKPGANESIPYGRDVDARLASGL